MKQILLLAFWAYSCSVAGQSRTVTGKVIDLELTIIGAVSIKHIDKTEIGATDVNGEFGIEIPSNTDSLVFFSQASN